MTDVITRKATDIDPKVTGSTAGGLLGAALVAAVMSWLPESASEVADEVSRIVEWGIGVLFVGISTFVGGYVTRSTVPK